MAQDRETVKLRYLRIAPRKVRLIANLLKGLTVNEAEAQLSVWNKRARDPVLKLLRSAQANAVHNRKWDPKKLVVEKIWVDQGPTLKRFLPRAQGRATPIHKKTSHITLILKPAEKEIAPRFNILVKESKVGKKDKKAKKPAAPKTAPSAVAAKPQEKTGFLKRIFRRKSV